MGDLEDKYASQRTYEIILKNKEGAICYVFLDSLEYSRALRAMPTIHFFGHPYINIVDHFIRLGKNNAIQLFNLNTDWERSREIYAHHLIQNITERERPCLKVHKYPTLIPYFTYEQKKNTVLAELVPKYFSDSAVFDNYYDMYLEDIFKCVWNALGV